jgi:hypothetical protein
MTIMTLLMDSALTHTNSCSALYFPALDEWLSNITYYSNIKVPSKRPPLSKLGIKASFLEQKEARILRNIPGV